MPNRYYFLVAHPTAVVGPSTVRSSVAARDMSEPRTFGPYTLLRRLAVGGMAEIHVAKTRGLGGFEKLVALKLVHPHLSADPQFVRMLIDEAKILVLLTHANIAQVFDLGCIDGTYYIAMEYVDGLDVHGLATTSAKLGQQLPIAVSCHVVSEMLNGLDYAHRKRDGSGRPLNLVHRDISPQNVMVSQAGDVKLVDFGIAKTNLQVEGTEVGVIKGKYFYMSPEQAWGDRTDRRSDVFSAGILLHEMLTGAMVYTGISIPQLIARVRQAEIPDPRERRPEVPAPLSSIVLRALARDPRDRFQSAVDMGEALRDFLYAFHPTFSAARLSEHVLRIVEARSRLALAAAANVSAAALPGAFHGTNASPSGILYAFGEPAVTRKETLPIVRDRRPSPPTARPQPPIPSLTQRNPDGQSRAIPRDTQGRARVSAWPLAEAVELEDPTQQWDVRRSSLAPKPQSARWPTADGLRDDDGLPTGKHVPLAPRAAHAALSLPEPPVERDYAHHGPATGTHALPPPPSEEAHMVEPIPRSPPLPDFRADSGRQPWIAYVLAALCAVVGGVAYHWYTVQRARGSLEIVSAPAGARVQIDGKREPSPTPLTLSGLVPERSYAIVVEAPGYEPWRATVRAPRGAVRQIVVLSPLTGEVDVRTSPPGAEVLLDGASMGRTPVTLHAVPVNRTVRLTLLKLGYRDMRRDLTLTPGARSSTVDVALAPM